MKRPLLPPCLVPLSRLGLKATTLLGFSGVALLMAASLSAAPSGRRVTIGNDGKLQGPFNGWAWVAAGEGVTVTAPNPCNQSGCFKNAGGQLCTKGTIPALTCTGPGSSRSCNWDKNWGVVLGMNTADPQGAWGTGAPRSFSVSYSSVVRQGSAGHFRLNAHVAGDPYSRQYCVDNYTPGAVVQPSDFKTECWFATGDTLTSFGRVDTVGLLRVSEGRAVPFDFCVTAVSAE